MIDANGRSRCRCANNGTRSGGICLGWYLSFIPEGNFLIGIKLALKMRKKMSRKSQFPYSLIVLIKFYAMNKLIKGMAFYLITTFLKFY